VRLSPRVSSKNRGVGSAGDGRLDRPDKTLEAPADRARREGIRLSLTGETGLGDGVLDQASAWLFRLREDLSLETVQAFEAWRSGSPGAAAAWDEVSRLWTLAGVALVVGPGADR
jgi:hypothetical protein